MKIRKILTSAIIICMTFILVTPLNASANEGDQAISISYNEDYENKDTGEYFIWKDSPISLLALPGSIAKNFEFKIKYSIISSDFIIENSSVTIRSYAHIEDSSGNNVNGYTGHPYSVDLIKGFTNNGLQFTLGQTEVGTITGLSSGNYKLEVSNNDRLPDSYYLVGSGSVINR